MFNTDPYTDTYNVEVLPATRNHQGSFVQEAAYKLMRIDKAGWAYICLDDTTCYYVDPADIREIANWTDQSHCALPDASEEI